MEKVHKSMALMMVIMDFKRIIKIQNMDILH